MNGTVSLHQSRAVCTRMRPLMLSCARQQAATWPLPYGRGSDQILLPLRALTACLLALLAGFHVLCGGAHAESIAKEVLAAVVKVRAEIPPAARTAEFLGTNREGSGVVIDAEGLILTIGYLVLEATQIEVSTADGKVVKALIVGSDSDTGFGLLRASEPLGITPLQLGQSSEVRERQQVLVVTEGRPESVQAAFVTSRREFVGYWEYLIEDAIFTAPPSPHFAGAALLGTQGQLLGIGSLFLNDALPDERVFPGNMFVPIDRLKPVLADLIAKGRPTTPPRPWLGVFTEEYRGHLFVAAVVPEGPAEKAGLKPGDLIAGIAGKAVNDRASFYRAVWAQGNAGVEVPLNILQGLEIRKIVVRSGDRDHYFQTQPTRSAPGDKRQTHTNSHLQQFALGCVLEAPPSWALFLAGRTPALLKKVSAN